jgi:hypothetical protein
MVGKQDRVGAFVCEGEQDAGEVSKLRTGADERETWQLAPGAIVSHSRVASTSHVLSGPLSNPPPRIYVRDGSQAQDVRGESSGAAARRGSAIRHSLRSASAVASIATFASDVGRDAARDVRREAGREGDAERWLARLAPETLPPGVERTVNDSHSKWYRLRLATTPLTVILEIEVWQGELWAHLAITGRTAPPTLAELGWCRDLFLGDRKAIQVLPRKIEAAEAGSRSVHLYVQLESDTLPSCSRMCHPSLREQA